MSDNTMPDEGLLERTASIVSAYVSNNSVQMGALPDVIASIYRALNDLRSDANEIVEKPLVPMVPINKSVTDDYIICLEDGKRFKSLKRHLRTSYGLTLDQYREKWKLPPNYPMVAPAYAARRSALARKYGLGRTIVKLEGTSVKIGSKKPPVTKT